MPRGKQQRCSGYLSSDGRYAYCTREEHAGRADQQPTDPPSYRHILEGACRCGLTHREAPATNQETYDYVDAVGRLLYQVVRLSGKQFRQRRPAPDGSWLWNLHGVTRVLYRLPAVLEAAAGDDPIYVVEGEKDVHAVERAGATATTNPGGAGKWRAEYATVLHGAAEVVIVADNDPPGIAHARQVAASLNGVPHTLVRAAAGKDVSDHLAAGHPLTGLLPLLDDEDLPQPEELPTAITDLANAERLIAKHGEQLHYCYPWGSWLHWQVTAWQTDSSGHVEALAQQVVRDLLAEAVRITDERLRGRTIRDVTAAERASRIAGAITLARSHAGIPIQPDDLDADPWLFNVENGTIDLRTGDRKAAIPEDLLTKTAPVDHEPTAAAPAWQAFLQRVLPNPSTREFLQRAVGYSLVGGNPAQILLILYGAGANGKSTFLETVRKLLGPYGQQAPPETFLAKHDGIPNDVARLRGARFVAAVEIGEGRRLNEPLIKRLTGGDTLVARYLRQEYFEFQPQFTPWLATNHKPEIRGTDEAIWRRIRLVPFTETIPKAEQDENLKARLAAELPGILNWALAGCDAWQQDGLAEPEQVRAATDEYREDSDILGAFLTDHCELGPDQRCLAADLYDTYKDWAKATGAEPLTSQSLGRRLTERGYERTRDRIGRGWRGLSVQGGTETLL